MPIRIEHQPSPYAVGVAGYAAGRGRARERQGKYALDLWQQNRQQEQQQAAWEQRQNQQNQFMDIRDQRRFLQGRATELPMVPDDLTDADQRNTLSRQRIGLGKMAGMIDPRDAAQMEAFEQGILDYMDALGKAPRADTAEKARRGMVWYNPDNPSEFSGKEVPGWIATQGQGFDPASVVADKANRQQMDAQRAQQQKEKQAAEQQRAMESWKADSLKRAELFDKMRTAVDENSKPLYSSNDEIRMEIDRIMGGPAQPPPTMTSSAPATAPAQQPAMPSSGETAGEQPIVVGPGMVAEPVPIPGQTPTGPRATPGAAAALRDPNTQASPIPLAPRSSPQASASPYVEEVMPVVGDLGGPAQRPPIMTPEEASNQTYQMLESVGGLTTEQQQRGQQAINQQARQQFDFTSLDRSNDRWAEQFMQGGGGLQQSPQAVPANSNGKPPVADASKFTPEMLQQARRIAQTPAGRAALQERYGVDFAMPEEQQQSIGPLDTTQRQHVEAMRGPQGTGEGIPSDAARVAGQVQGAGSLAGRTAGYARRDAGQLLPGQTRTTKYNVTPTADEREAAMNDRYARAMRMKEEREAAQPDTLSMGVTSTSSVTPSSTVAKPRPKPTPSDVAGNLAKRKADMNARSNAVAAQGIGKGIERAQRLGKAVPTVQRAIRAAVMGDVAAQKALDERGIRWRT